MLKPVPKPNHKRRVPKRGNLTKITQKARKAVYERANGKCERCGITNPYCFEVAHLKSAAQGGSGRDPSNLILACGPSVNSNTCHHWMDYTEKGREWRMAKRKELKSYYERQNRTTNETTN